MQPRRDCNAANHEGESSSVIDQHSPDDDEVWEIILNRNEVSTSFINPQPEKQVNAYDDDHYEERDYYYKEEEYDYESDYDELDYYEDADRELLKKRIAGGFSINPSCKVQSYQPNDKSADKFRQRICLEKFEGLKYNANVVNKVADHEKKETNAKYRIKDKSDRATSEQALDPRTMLILQNFVQQKFIHQIHGCFSTGKEANVYYGIDLQKNEYAIKVYKTSILTFKDRDKYVSGDYKFRHGYGKHNPRKMVRMWAEKEFSNLHKLEQGGIRVPKPHKLKTNVLAMEFIGKDSYPAPRLKDADISVSKSRELYMDIVIIMWTMYKVCKLVHADLSEFNILYYLGNLCIIDVSQSVTPDHVNAFDFLRSDCKNITEFFRKKGVPTMTIRELFCFIVDPTITLRNRDLHLDRLREAASDRDPYNVSAQEKTNEATFLEVFIPKSLNQVIDFENDLRALKIGFKTEEDIYYTSVLGLKSDLSGPKQIELQESDYDSVEEEEDNIDENRGSRRPLGRPKDETGEDKKSRKKAVKDAQAEKRTTKMKKHDKKRCIKVSRKLK